ncbi:transcriptional regulator GcvA [uncultured Roseobacter sp.]|uniref:transcriptional regulator GcvA n=1 Tax=uncultured Roseobacter sp. TaxID=114847 RepID=UPI0026392AE1|nr:transcriptional regulator GcvA [uncultured Roseobacter sp.]
MRKIPPLNSLKAFEASGRHLNFRLAADELRVTQGAVAQQVRALEKHLKVNLFNRHARGLSLTDQGRRYLAPLVRAFDIIANATEDLAPVDAVVTISATPSFATRWLVPRLGELSAAHPDIRVRLDASNALANFQTDGVDIAIRQGKPPFGPGLVAEPILDNRVVAVCHPDLTRGERPIIAASDLIHHVLLEDTHGQWPVFLEAVLDILPATELRTMSFSQTSLAIDAAIAGQGVALANRALVAAELSDGRLCQPFAFSIRTEDGFYVVAPRKPRQPKLVAIVRDWLKAQD